MTAPHDPGAGFEAEVRAAWEGCAVDGPTWPQEVRRLGEHVLATLLWRQHPRSEAGMPGDPWRTQQDAVYQALRTILQARGFRLLADTGAAPVVVGARSA